jgi:hypothetical protein
MVLVFECCVKSLHARREADLAVEIEILESNLITILGSSHILDIEVDLVDI